MMSYQVYTNVHEFQADNITAQRIATTLSELFPKAQFIAKPVRYATMLIQGRLTVERQPSRKTVDAWVVATKAILAYEWVLANKVLSRPTTTQSGALQ